MNNLILTTGITAVVLYLSAGGLLIRQLALSASGRGDQSHSIRNLALLATLIGVIAHAVLLYGRVFTPEGLDMGFFNALSLAGWLICALLVALALRQPVENLGIAILPFAALSLVLQLAAPEGMSRPVAADGPIQAHIVCPSWRTAPSASPPCKLSCWPFRTINCTPTGPGD